MPNPLESYWDTDPKTEAKPNYEPGKDHPEPELRAKFEQDLDDKESNLKKRMKELTEQRDGALFEQFSGLTFNRFQEVNKKRCEVAFRHPVNTWSINDWATATGGEIGEAIQELGKILTFLDTAKKIKRGDNCENNPEELEILLDKLAEELADIITYADLTMTRIRRNTEVELVKKFNKVSDKRRSNIKL